MTLNRRFHDAILDAAHNHFLRKAAVGVQASFPLLGDSNLLDKPRARAAHAQHALEYRLARIGRDPGVPR